jgi:cytochrome c peroxidase
VADPAPAPLFDTLEWSQLQSLTGLPDPSPDPSNKYVGSSAAADLGQAFYFDPSFSGTSTLQDTIGGTISATQGRGPKGAALGIACVTCHDPSQGGTDHTSVPGNVSIGGGAYDVNSNSTLNAAYYKLIYWNGRNDSLWAQIVAVGESPVSMAGNRLWTAWRIADAYRDAYEAVFTDYPLPMAGTVADAKARLDTDGQCLRVAGACPQGCRADTGAPSTCYPRFPLQGRPGATAGCQRGSAAEPFGDAFDCMDPDDQDAVTRIYVNFAKAIAAYEFLLISRDAPFDRFIAEGQTSTAISLSAQRGAKVFVGGKAVCIECHSGQLLSDNDFHDIGVGQDGAFVPKTSDCAAGNAKCDCVAGKSCLPWGFRDGLAKLQTNKFRRDSKWSDDLADNSRASYYTAPLADNQKGAWRTPSLRNVELTGPYMHDGVYQTLEQVIDHYDRGGDGSGDEVGVLDYRIAPLHLTSEEKADLVEFLKTLTGAALPTALTTAPALPPATTL